MNTPSNKAYLYLIKLISFRDYSEHKLREKLREKKYPANEIDSAINEIKTKGYLKEELYTEARVKGFMNKGYSPNYIRQKLAQEHLTVTEEEIDRLARKKMHGKTEFDYEGQSKILRFLLSKGHDFGTSKKVLKSIIGELQEQLN